MSLATTVSAAQFQNVQSHHPLIFPTFNKPTKSTTSATRRLSTNVSFQEIPRGGGRGVWSEEDEEDEEYEDERRVVSTQKSRKPESSSNSIKNNEDDDSDNKIPTLFKLPEEGKYDRYAACLAATEGLRKMRDRELKHQKSSVWTNLLKKNTAKMTKEEEERAHSKYIMNSSKVIRALGLTIPQFNQLGREIMTDDLLKEKVMEQAYLYRLTSTLTLPNNRIPLLTPSSQSAQLRKAHKRRQIQMFAHSITEIESLRKDQLQKLLKALQLPKLPTGFQLSDPMILPLLNPKIRAVCEAFPLQAEEIVRNYGLNSDEFNEMLAKSKTSKKFRRKVQNELVAKSKKEE